MRLFPHLGHPAFPHLARYGRPLAFAFGLAAAMAATSLPAMAQGLQLLRDTETEEMLRSYEEPLAKAAGLNPSPRVWLLGNGEINAFATFGDGGENIFIFAGILMFTKTPNELIGVMAHETGHISGGHIISGGIQAQKAATPMLLAMLAGVAAMFAGAGNAGMVLMGAGQAIAQAQMAAFSRVQEAAADQIALNLLLRTRQSPRGVYDTFNRFAQDEARSAYRINPFAVDHPVGQDRLANIETGVESSPFRDVKDSPQVMHTFEMVQAKLAGYTLPVAEAMKRFPETDTTAPARYARAMIYLRQPQLQKALAEIGSLIQEEPNNPYFYEVQGQIYLSMARPDMAIPSYQKAVNLKPIAAPQLRLALAVAQLATDRPDMSQQALSNLKIASLTENDDAFTWYETAQAYSNLKNEPMANLATAEFHYSGGNYKEAAMFAVRARGKLAQGSGDWARANDIIGASAQAAREERQR